MNREWKEIIGTKENIQRCLRQIGHSGAKIVRAGRENIFAEVHRDELRWLQTTVKDLGLRMRDAPEPTCTAAPCGAYSINVTQHQIACTACKEKEKEKENTMSQNKQLFRNRDRAEAIRDYATKFPTAPLDTFIEPLQEQGWALGHNRAAQMKTLDNALRPYRGAASNQRGYLLQGRAYVNPAEAIDVAIEGFTSVDGPVEMLQAENLISTIPDPGIDVEDLIGTADIEVQGTPEPVHSNVEEPEPEPAATPATIVTDSVLITTLDGLVQMAQQRVDEHMTLADQWENIKGTIMPLVSEFQASEEKVRSAQAEVEAARSKLNAVIAAMGDNESKKG